MRASGSFTISRIEDTKADGSSLYGPRNEHSQMVKERQARSKSWVSTRRSRRTLRSIFARQNAAFERGQRKRWHACPCQKHPWTKTASRAEGNRMSGLKGKPGVFEPITKAVRGQKAPELHFRTRVPAPDAPHDAAALFRREHV
jgi:hypothetical protein